MTTVFLFDTDTTCHCAAVTCLDHHDIGNEEYVSTFSGAEIKTQVTDAVRMIARNLHDLMGLGKERAKIVCTLSAHGPRWREDVYPPYKASRSNRPKPTGYNYARKVVRDTFETVEEPRLEGDDVLGLLATGRFAADRTVVVSIDKDLQQVPGLLYNPDRPEDGLVTVTEESAHRMHMLQTLMGDSVDGYPGCPGIGKVRAARLLDSSAPETWWELVCQAYEEKELTEDDALVMARIARIMVDGDYDWKTKEVKLWEPI